MALKEQQRISVYYIYTYVYAYRYVARDAIKLALPGFRQPVDWWDLPTRLEWALAPDRGAGVTKLGPWLDAWPSGVCVGLGSRTEDLILLGPAAKVQAGFLG